MYEVLVRAGRLETHPLARSPLLLAVALIGFWLLLLNSDETLAAEAVNTSEALIGVVDDVSDDPDPVPGKIRRGNFLAVPIPTSNPTIGSGVIGVAGYFWGQSDRQKATQPPSVSGLGVMYTSSKSWAVGVGQTAYWNEDTWRFTGVAGVANLKLPLLVTELLGQPFEIDWDIDGWLAYTELSRRIFGHWYFGLQARYLDISQSFSVDFSSIHFDLPTDLSAASLGPTLSRDTRDSHSYPTSGSYLDLTAFHTQESGFSDNHYESYDLKYRSYHRLADPLVLAWRVQLCTRAGRPPLWDACMIGLRGFPATQYMSHSSEMAEAEARWQITERWGAAFFAGAGLAQDTFSGRHEDEVIPSYGVGLRFLVQKTQRVNLRVDYGRSRGVDGVYISVGETF